MAHVTLYLDDELAARLRAAAEEEGVSQSRWVSELIAQRLSDEWPPSVVELAGAWPDMPLAEELRGVTSHDAQREAL